MFLFAEPLYFVGLTTECGEARKEFFKNLCAKYVEVK